MAPVVRRGVPVLLSTSYGNSARHSSLTLDRRRNSDSDVRPRLGTAGPGLPAAHSPGTPGLSWFVSRES